MTDEKIEQTPTDDSDVTTRGGNPARGTGLRAAHERDAYGTEVETAEVVHSELVGLAELSSEYTADHATQDTDAAPEETLDAWSSAREDWDEPPRR